MFYLPRREVRELLKDPDMRSSEKLIENIKKWEGYRAHAYKCPAGVWTIGYGHTKGVREGDVTTRDEADRMLRGDVYQAERTILNIPELSTQGRFDAVCDFVYNIGYPQFRNSTLYKYIKGRKTDKQIQAEFRRWVYAGGVKLRGLVKRREWEAQRWIEND